MYTIKTKVRKSLRRFPQPPPSILAKAEKTGLFMERHKNSHNIGHIICCPYSEILMLIDKLGMTQGLDLFDILIDNL